jgi:hypothetical protein
MSVLVSSDLAVAYDYYRIYAYYQDDNGNLKEAISVWSDGEYSRWTTSDGNVATGLVAGGSPISAYYVEHDGLVKGYMIASLTTPPTHS